MADIDLVAVKVEQIVQFLAINHMPFVPETFNGVCFIFKETIIDAACCHQPKGMPLGIFFLVSLDNFSCNATVLQAFVEKL